MKELEIVSSSFNKHSELLGHTLEKHSESVVLAAKLIIDAFEKGGKVVIFGNGGSAADSQHLAAEFIGRFLGERKSLPAIAISTDTSVITSIGNDFGFEKIFERQVESLVSNNDVVIAISTSGNSENVIRGVVAAKNNGAKIIALTGEKGGSLNGLADILLDIPSNDIPRIQEMHILVGHTICNIVESHYL